MPAPNDPFVTLGVITGAHGIKGAVKLRSFTGQPEDVASYALHDEAGKAFPLKIIGEAKGQLICTLENVRYRDKAEALKGTKLGVARSELPEPEQDEFYIEDLIGMRVMLEDGSTYGSVKAVHNFGAGDIVEITNTNGKEEMFSFTQATFPSLDTQAKTLTLSQPETLAPPSEER